MIVWTMLFALMFSITIFGFNLLLLLTIAITPKLHSTANILSCNLWMANCILGVINIFHSLFFNLNNINPMLFATNQMPIKPLKHVKYYHITTSGTLNFSTLLSAAVHQKNAFLNLPIAQPQQFRSLLPSTLLMNTKPISHDTGLAEKGFPHELLLPKRNAEKPFRENNALDYMLIFGPQTLVALFNTTISLLTLLAIAFIQLFSRQQQCLSKSAPIWISIGMWLVVLTIVSVNYALVQFTQSFALIIAFQLALVSIFLMFNLVLYPLNLFKPQNSQLSKAITQSLWLLLHSLSFTLLAMMLVWEGVQQFSSLNGTNVQSFEENAQLVIIQLTAYSLHCIGNPIIAVLREPHLARALMKLINRKNNSLRHYLVENATHAGSAGQRDNNWYILIPPPPPYQSSSCRSVCSESSEDPVSNENTAQLGSNMSLNSCNTHTSVQSTVNGLVSPNKLIKLTTTVNQILNAPPVRENTQ